MGNWHDNNIQPNDRTDKNSPHSSIISLVCQNDRVFVYELRDCGLEYRCCHLEPVMSSHSVWWASQKEALSLRQNLVKIFKVLRTVLRIIQLYEPS